MDRTKSRLATFFNTDDDDESSFPQKAVDNQKLSQYAQGTVRKSRRDKLKEEVEAKQREEEQLAAKTYAEFLDAFEGEGQRKGAAFVKAGGSSAGPSAYNTALRNSGGGPSGRGGHNEPRSMSPPPVSSAPKPKGKRAMDAFLEEIKREQAERESRLARHSTTQGRSVTALAAYEGQSGSKDRGDPLTSNIFVANLPPHVTEMTFGNFFASRCGPVGSVKIMWPRGDTTQGPGADMTATRNRKNTGLSGFVSFMKRKDAETAVREVDGFDWGGSILRVGWSKAVPVAARATYVVNRRSRSRSPERDRDRRGHHDRSRSYSRDRDRSHSRSRGDHHDRRARSYSRSRSRDRRRRSRSRSYSRSRRYSNSRSRSPRRHRSDSPYERGRTGVDPDTEKFIKTVASKVKEHGETFEDVLRERERENLRFAFLFDNTLPENRLYRSLLAGEALIEGFEDEGYNSIYSTDSGEESEREIIRKTKLGKYARKRFEAMLRALSGRRGDLARCMAFSLEHAEAASEVTDIIVGSLVVDSTPVPRKVARLHLICDILHNSAASVPNAWKFRQEFQSRLGIVFDHLSSIYHSFPGRITAETFKKQIMAVIDIWEDWIVFTPDFTAALKSRLEGASETEKLSQAEEDTPEAQQETTVLNSKFTASSFKPAADPVEVPSEAANTSKAEDGEEDMEVDSDLEAKEGDDIDGEPVDIDGEPIDDDLDGEPLDGEPLDGESLDGEPIDGDPMDDDVDGIPVQL